MMKKITQFSLLLFIGLIATSFNSSIKWKLEKSKNGIQVYSYKPVGENLKQLKSHTKIKTSLSSLIHVLSDVEGYKNWIYKCAEAKKIKQLAPNKMVYYTVNNAPWPVEDRELYAVNKYYQDKKTKIVYSISEPLANIKIPPVKGLVRVTNFYGKWQFTPIGNGEVVVDYFLKLDPAGSIPDWVVNMTLEVGPYQSLVNFKKEVLKEEHQQANYKNIEEPKD